MSCTKKQLPRLEFEQQVTGASSQLRDQQSPVPRRQRNLGKNSAARRSVWKMRRCGSNILEYQIDEIWKLLLLLLTMVKTSFQDSDASRT